MGTNQVRFVRKIFSQVDGFSRGKDSSFDCVIIKEYTIVLVTSQIEEDKLLPFNH